MGIQMNESQNNTLDPKISSTSESNTAHWLKAFVIGSSGAGKTSLLKTLIDDSPTLTEQSNESLKKLTWRPGNDFKIDLLPETDAKINQSAEPDGETIPWENLRIDFWDFCGRSILRPIQMLGVTPGGFFLVVFSLLDVSAPIVVASWIRTMQIKVPGSIYVLVGTHSDKLLSERKKRTKIKNVMDQLDKENLKEIAEIKISLSTLKSDAKHKRSSTKFSRVEHRLLKRPKIHETIFPVSCVNSEGIAQLREELIKLCMDTELFPVLNQSKKFLLYLPIIDHLKNAGHVMIPRSDFAHAVFKNVIHKEDKQLDEILTYFEKLGMVIDFRSCGHVHTNSRHLVCVNPVGLVQCACALHIDTASKAFRFDSSRFWPKDSGRKKPDPGILVSSLEEIPAKSLIQETLLPLLWQDYMMSNNQLIILLEELIRLGILVRGSWPAPEEELVLPNFTSLSSDKKVCVIQLHRLPNSAPCLNWTSKPFTGDAQLSLRYEFPGEAPPGTCLRLVGFCGSLAEQWYSYSHWWKDGLLLRLGECWLCISYSLERYVELTCRINAEEVEGSTGENLWLHLVPFLFSIEDFFDRHMPGLVFKTTVQPIGNIFGLLSREESPWITVQSLVAALSSGNSVFKKTFGDREIEYNLKNIFPYKDISLQDSGYIGQVLGERCLAKFDKLIASRKLEEKSGVTFSPKQLQINSKKSNNDQRIEIKWALDRAQTSQQAVSAAPSKSSPKGASDNTTSPSEQSQSIPGGGILVNEAEELERMERIVFSFVASIMAQATAEIVSTEADDQHKLTNRDPLVAAAQREMANITSKAIQAAQLGDHVGACRSVVAAANAVHRTIKRRDQYNEAPKSKLCAIM